MLVILDKTEEFKELVLISLRNSYTSVDHRNLQKVFIFIILNYFDLSFNTAFLSELKGIRLDS